MIIVILVFLFFNLLLYTTLQNYHLKIIFKILLLFLNCHNLIQNHILRVPEHDAQLVTEGEIWVGFGRDVGGMWVNVGGMWVGCGWNVGGMWVGCGWDVDGMWLRWESYGLYGLKEGCLNE